MGVLSGIRLWLWPPQPLHPSGCAHGDPAPISVAVAVAVALVAAVAVAAAAAAVAIVVAAVAVAFKFPFRYRIPRWNGKFTDGDAAVAKKYPSP